MIAPVDEVANHNIVGLRWFFSNFEEMQDVEELSVDVPRDGDGGIDRLHVGLFEKYLYHFFAELFDLRLRGQLALPDLLEELVHIEAHGYGL